MLILSDKLEDLGPASAALLGLLFPMQWPHTVIPVLPVSLLHYLEAPVPFVMGMDASALGRVTADLSCITIVNLVRRVRRDPSLSVVEWLFREFGRVL